VPSTETRKLTLQTFDGPSLIAPFAATVVEFENPHAVALPAFEIQKFLGALFRLSGPARVAFASDAVDFPNAVAALALTWQEIGRPLGLNYSVTPLGGAHWRVAVGHFSPARGRDALRAALKIADAIFANRVGPQAGSAPPGALLRHIATLAHSAQFGAVSLAFLKAARRCGIPAYEPAPGTNALIYGQGARALHHSEALCSLDTATGFRFAQDKMVSNHLVTKLGFPGTRHIAVENIAAARQAAAKLGTPLVVKPIDRNGSIGVSVGIETQAELDAAVLAALQLSNSAKALVEKFIDGDEHRLSVFAGKLFRASKLVPAHIVGDGRRTIAEIVAAENAARRAIKSSRDAFVQALKLDEKAVALLAKQGFTPDGRPAEGQIIRLAGTSNLKSGGRREEVTALIHPDNVAMAEAIARSFHLDAAGIDFITPDISRSWTEIPCAVIEVNANPGTDEEMAVHIFRRRFGDGSDGRIPSVLVLGAPGEVSDAIEERFVAAGKRVGRTDNAKTSLSGAPRFPHGGSLPERILGLLLDASCDALIVEMTQDDIARFGLPHTRYDLALISGGECPREIENLIAANAAHVLNAAESDRVNTALGALLDKD